MSLPDYMVLCRGGDLTDHVEVTTQDHLAKLNGSADYRRDPNEMVSAQPRLKRHLAG
jgi:hypothetical protein